jgi:phosphatidylglycerol:prolipoprotein diacylglycerol transferase
MYPLIQIGSLTLPTYGLLLSVAIISALFLSISTAKRFNHDVTSTWKVLGLATLTGMAICRFGDLLLHPSLYSRSPSLLLTNGGTFLFGFLGAILMAVALSLRYRISIWILGDCCAPYLALGIAIGRVGCFLAGCDYGKPSSRPWSVTFTSPVAASVSGVPLNVPLHPSQLYESIYEFLLFALLLFFSRKHPTTGTLIWAFVLLYSIGRFLIEFTRGDADRGFWGPLSVSQWLCGILIVVLLILNRIPLTHRGVVIGKL